MIDNWCSNGPIRSRGKLDDINDRRLESSNSINTSSNTCRIGKERRHSSRLEIFGKRAVEAQVKASAVRMLKEAEGPIGDGSKV